MKLQIDSEMPSTPRPLCVPPDKTPESYRVVVDYGNSTECLGQNLTSRVAEELIESYCFENPKPQDSDFPVVRKEKE